VAAAVVGVGALLVAVDGAGGSPQQYAAAGPPAADPRALDPTALVRVDPHAWQATARLDFTAWPARGNRTSDTALLGRALAVWADPGPSVDVTATPGTTRTGPALPAQLLFAGDVDDATVVVLYDGLRLVRYARPRHGDGRAALDFAQAQDAGPTTAAAVLVDRVDGRARFLTAPWVADAEMRDLLAPDRPAAVLHRSADGVTDPVRTPGAAGGGCGMTWPALQLRSSPAIADKHGFLLTDLGDLLPTHLTYTPPPGSGSAAGPPREATGPQALVSWAHRVCGLRGLRGQGVKSVDDWEFARTALPEGAGEASWTCERADTWRGPGLATVSFVPPGTAAAAPGAVVGRQQDGNACSRFDPHVMAGVLWRSPGGTWYLLAAGSRDVNRIAATHGVTAAADGRWLAVPAAPSARPTLTARLRGGAALTPLG
jgi:hypothetical protein